MLTKTLERIIEQQELEEIKALEALKLEKRLRIENKERQESLLAATNLATMWQEPVLILLHKSSMNDFKLRYLYIPLSIYDTDNYSDYILINVTYPIQT